MGHWWGFASPVFVCSPLVGVLAGFGVVDLLVARFLVGVAGFWMAMSGRRRGLLFMVGPVLVGGVRDGVVVWIYRRVISPHPSWLRTMLSVPYRVSTPVWSP